MEPVTLPVTTTYPPGQEPPQDEISLPTSNTTDLPLPPDAARQLATKADQGGVAQLIQRTKNELQIDFGAGKEKLVRDQIASAVDAQKDQQRQKQITEMAQRYGPLNSEQVMKLMDPWGVKTDPDAVIERAYAHSYIGTLATAPGFAATDNVFDMASREIAKQSQETMDTADDLTTKNQYLLGKLQKMQQLTSEQSWFAWGVDQLKGVSQLYPEYKQRGLVDGIKFAGIGLGSNLDEQSNTLYRKPFDDFKQTVDHAVDYLGKDNPSLAVSFLQSMYGQDEFEKVTNNVFSAMALPDLALGGKLLKKVLTYNQIRKAAKDMVQAAAKDPEGSKVNMVAAAGDTQESAVLQVAQQVTDTLNGNPNPIKTSKDTLLTTWKQSADNATANPGTYLSRESLTRVLDGFVNDGKALLDKIVTMNRVERQPLAVTSENVIRAYKDKIRGDFKGPNAMVGDIDGPYIETASNTKWFKVHFLDHDGSMFSDRETAVGRNDSLNLGHAIEGEAGDRVYIPQAAVKHLRPEGTGSTFLTSKGSSYTVEGETTIRNKAARPEHPGEEGLQPKSEHTYYVTKDHLNELSLFQTQGGPKMALAETRDERLGVKYLEGKDKGKFEKRTAQKFEIEPKVGLYPVELWKKGTRVHFGNEITEVHPRTRIQEIRNGRVFTEGGVEVQSSPTPQPGFIPYNVKTNKFEKPLTEASAHIEQQGLGFRIVHWVPMQETSNVLRDLMIRDINGNLIPETVGHSSSTGTKSIINSVLGWVRNSDETMSIQESAQRKAVVYSQSNIHKWAADLNKPINKVKNQNAWWKPTAYLGKVTGRDVVSQFERALKNAQQTQTWFKGPGELQDFYLRNFHRNPSVLETEAYFNYVKLVEGDRMLGEIAEFRNRARVGAEQHKIRLIGPDGKPIYSNLFDGVTLKRLPSNSDQILFTGDKKGEESLKETARIDTKARREIERDISEGRSKLVEVYDIDHHPLDNFSEITKGQRIRYVLSRNVESNPISFNHVNKKEGGHFDWDYDHFIKQADMRQQSSGKHIYIGDTTIMPIGNKALGEKVIKLWNEAQDLIKVNKWEEAKPIVAKMGIQWKEFTGWYKAGRDEAGGVTRPKLNPHEPVYVVQKGKNILSIDDSLPLRYRVKDKNGNIVNRFEDGSRTGLANNFKVAYNTERHTDFNFRTINDIGTKDNPIFAHQPAKLVDPLPTMNRALNRAISSAFMDDYKLYAIEHWLREAEPHLDVEGGRDAIRSAPFWHFNQPKYKTSTPANIKWNLESHRYKISTFVGVPSKFDTWVHTFTEHLANVAYDNYGPVESRTALQKARTITPIWLLHHVTNPVDFIRGVTFNFKLGLFNPAQFLVQAQTHALIWSLEPTHGTVGTYAMLLHGWSKVNRNPAILRSLDNYYTKLNMFGSKPKPGEFLEAQRELDKTGFEHVAGEYANMSKAYTPTTNFLQGDISKGLKIGQTPFRLGEASTRVTAWYTAFRKWRAENPTKPIGNVERNQILQHADMLTVNMSRASSSMINHGVFSLSTQFLSYQIKLAELFWSKRIDNMARARIITGFSLLYGLPNAIGVTGAPVSDNLRQHFIDDLGYIPGEKWMSTMLNEGYPAWSLAMITGKGDLQRGNVENVGDRFGSQGWQNIKQGLRSDIPWYMAIGGAGVTTMNNFISSALDPFYQGALSWARGDTGDSRFTIKGADLVEPLKEASTVNAGIKWWTALQTGHWINKNEGNVTDVSPLRATFLAMTGMNPQAQDDMFIKNSIVKGEEDAKKKALKEFIKDWQRSVQAFENGDPEQGNAYVNNGMARFAAVGYPYEEILKAIAIASKGQESAIQSSDYSFWSKGDRNKQEQRLEQYRRQLELDKKKK